MNNDRSIAPHFDEAFRTRLLDLYSWRRDVRRFRTEPLPPGMLERFIEIACLAPSVGLSQPWRFVIVGDPGRRQAATDNFESCNADALSDYTGDLSTRYAALKLAGLREAPCHLAVFADRATIVGHGLGRRTMPEMADYSAVTAVFSIWLAARASGISALVIRRLKMPARNWSVSAGNNVGRRETVFCTDDSSRWSESRQGVPTVILYVASRLGGGAASVGRGEVLITCGRCLRRS
jgi:5,6-dimethylbenzimidazole synthase